MGIKAPVPISGIYCTEAIWYMICVLYSGSLKFLSFHNRHPVA